MNFLPFIISILTLLALVVSMQGERSYTVCQRISAELSACKQRRAYTNEGVSRAYKKAGSTNNPPHSHPLIAGSAQLRNDPCCRLNIAPLLRGEANAPLRKATLRLLRAFYPELDADRFLQSCIRAANGTAVPLERLPVEPRDLYYNLLRGKRGSYPSLLELFSNEGDHICLRHATEPFIQALFGQEAGRRIYAAIHPPQQKRQEVPIDTLQAICAQCGELEPLILELVSTRRHNFKRVRWRSADGNLERLFPEAEAQSKTAPH